MPKKIQTSMPKLKLPIMSWLRLTVYHLYAEVISRLTTDQDQRPIPPVPCQFCGGRHTEQFCPNARKMGFLSEE